MSGAGTSKAGAGSGPRTRHQSGNKLVDLVGPGKEFNPSEVPTLRAVMQKGILIKESMLEGTAKTEVHVKEIVQELVPLIEAQWQKSNPKFCPPVTIKQDSIEQKLSKLWKRVSVLAQNRAKQAEKEKLLGLLDRLFDITVCNCPIKLCSDPGSKCKDVKECTQKAHNPDCTCPRDCKVPAMELRWLAGQRAKIGEKSDMRMSGVDKKETAKQQKATKRKADEQEAEIKRGKKKEAEDERMMEQLNEEYDYMLELDEAGDVGEPEFHPPWPGWKSKKEETRWLVDRYIC
jgi:hypothetical protein